jgi:hypothetical protein
MGGLKPKRRMKINCYGIKAKAIQGDHSIKKWWAKAKRRMKINCHGLKAMAIQGDHSIKKMKG